ncbi:polysaccharide deacetylase family protein [Micromonospora zhanjiangensis]
MTGLVAGCAGAGGGHRAVISLPRAVPSGPAAEGDRPAAAQPLPPGPLGRYVAKLPAFPPAPAPTPVTVPPGPAAGWYSRIQTTDRVAFLTIDDGWVKKPEAIELLTRAKVPVTLFLTVNAIKDNPDYFTKLRDAGATIEAHTVSHPSLTGRSYAFQRKEICGSADWLAQRYGRRPVLFRPPFGNKDATTLRAVRDCGMKAAFFWTETVDKGKVRYQKGHTVQPGDIILMHFRPAFADDFLAALTAIHKAGLTPAVLGDYVN